jgi:23S rRNA-intervening sequence protein
MGTISSAHIGDLHLDLEISSRGTLWIDQPDSTMRRFRWSEYRRGCGKIGNNEFQRFLQIASGSASELDYELQLAKDLGYLSKSDCSRIADELSQIRKILSSLLRKVNVDRKS